MLQLLAELYATAPEEGDIDKPKLVMFIDEAHLLFEEATGVLLQQIETVIKLNSFKRHWYFLLHTKPTGCSCIHFKLNLGLKVQHALRAFTAADRKTIKQAAENYPETEFYKTEDLLTQMGIGEALVTLLNEKGIPTPLVHTMLCPPKSRMNILSEAEINAVVSNSKLVPKYNREINNESAYEILNEKLEVAAQKKEEIRTSKQQTKVQNKQLKRQAFLIPLQ